MKDHFLADTNFEALGEATTHPRFTVAVRPIVSIRNAPPELPDAAIIARLKLYGDIDFFPSLPTLELDHSERNSHRSHAAPSSNPFISANRVRVDTICLVQQPATHLQKVATIPDTRPGHVSTFACFNCDELGHVEFVCEEPTRCSICKSISHKAFRCPYAVIDDLNENLPVAAVSRRGTRCCSRR